MADKIKIGIIGSGARGRALIRCVLGMSEKFQVIAAADNHQPSLDELKQLVPDANTYTEYKQMLASEDLEAIIIASPNYLHCEHAIPSLEAGLHVLLEKPMALSTADCRLIMETAEKNKRILQIGMEMHYHIMTREIWTGVNNRMIGDLRMLSYEEFRSPFYPKVNDWIIQSKYSGGTLVEKLCHGFDIFRWFADADPVRVFAAAGHDVVHKADNGLWKDLKGEQAQQDVIDNGIITVEFANGLKCAVLLAMFAPYMKHYMNFIGSKGSIRAHLADFTYDVYSADNPDIIQKKAVIEGANTATEHGGAEYGMFEAFYNSIIDNAPVEVDGIAGLYSIAVGLAAEKSAVEGRSVAIAEIME